MGKEMSGAQLKFLENLLEDIRRLFFQGRLKASERDLANWMGGIYRKHMMGVEEEIFEAWRDVQAFVRTLDSYRARRLIGALVDLRDRMDRKLPRDKVRTPSHLIRAIWSAARIPGYDEEWVRDVVFDVTKGESSSVKNLRREEAVVVIKRLGGRAPVAVHPPSREGASAWTK